MNKTTKRKIIKKRKRCKELNRRNNRNQPLIKFISSKEAYYRMENNWPISPNTSNIKKRIKVATRALLDRLRGRRYCIFRFPDDIEGRVCLYIKR